MLSRIAHELFWLGRSVARAERTARMLDGAFNAELEGRQNTSSRMTFSWEALLAVMGTSIPAATPGPIEPADVMELLVADRACPTSIATSIDQARERARAVRFVISLEMWSAINTFQMELRRDDLTETLRREPAVVFDLIRERCAIFWGIQRRTMLRDDGWAFLHAGAEFESAQMVLRMLRATLAPHADDIEAEATSDGPAVSLLRAAGGLHAYRRSVSAPPSGARVARFLLYERDYPDSVAACLDALRRALSNADTNAKAASPVLRVARLDAHLDFLGGESPGASALAETLETVQRELTSIDRDLAERYFGGADQPALRTAER